MKKALPKYFDYFGLAKPSLRGLENYQVFCRCVDEIIAHADEPISRNGFDHLVWYYFKGRK